MSKSQVLPKYVDVLGERIKIRVEPLDDNHGQFDREKMIITIDEDQTLDEIYSAYLHEVLHAAFWISGLSFLLGDKLEEAIVRMLERVLIKVITKIK